MTRIIGAYRGRLRWVCENGRWVTQWNPPLNLPLRSRFEVDLPPPPPMGGTTNETAIEFEFFSVDENT